MTAPNAQELALLRTQPHRSKAYLSIYDPDIVFQAQVNDASVAKGQRIIPYDNVTLGAFTDLDVGMTLRVGTSPGAGDKGSIYIANRDASTITVGENDHIDWEDDDHLTAVDFWQIWPVFPRFEQVGGVVDIYKAHDVAYTDQNSVLGTLICMGPHHAAFLDESGTAQVYFTSEGTHNLLDESISYEWEFEGSTSTGSTEAIPGYIEYDTPGHYFVRLTTTSASGAVDLAVRHVSIYDHPDRGHDTPYLDWGFEGLTGNRSGGGYRARIWVREDVSALDYEITDGALVVVFTEDWYGATKQSIGGNAANRSGIFFVGYILDGSINYDHEKSVVTFEVGSPTEIMKMCEAWSVSVQSSTNPTQDASDEGLSPWVFLKDLSVERALFHYYRWHSTVNVCADIEYTPEDREIQFFDSDRTSLYDAVHGFLANTIVGNLVSDRQGKLWAEKEYAAQTGTSSAIIQLSDQDWYGEPSIREQVNPRLSFIEMGGIAFSGPETGDYGVPFLAGAPGETPGYRGSPETRSGLALLSQQDLNEIVGGVFAWENSRYPEVSFNMAGNWRIFDIAPQEIVEVSLSPADNVRGLSWSNKAFIPQDISWEFLPEVSLMVPEVRFHERTIGVPGDTITIPEEPPDEGFEEDIDPIPPPPIPPPGGFGRVITMNFVVYEGGGNLTAGEKGTLKADFSGTILGAYLIADGTGECDIDIWVATFPSIPTVSESIVGGEYLSLGGNQTDEDVLLTGWTRAFGPGSLFTFSVRSTPTPDVGRVTIALKIFRD